MTGRERDAGRRVCTCLCHRENDSEQVPFCLRCDNDYADLCGGADVNP